MTPRGEWSEADSYGLLDVCVFRDCSYIATTNDPGRPSAEGSHWMMLAGRGPQGKTGRIGPRGDKGEQGDAAQAIARFEVSAERFAVVPYLESGAAGPAIHLRSLFEELIRQTSNG